MKTRSNMPLFVVECSDIKALSNSQIDLLRCGDYLVKKDASGQHAYKVSYKKDGVGICLTYCDGSGYIETVSYDYTDGNWVYNSTDVFNGGEIPNVEDAPSGTIQDALGLNSSGKLVKGAVSGGTQLYQHKITAHNNLDYDFYIYSLDSTPFTSINIATFTQKSIFAKWVDGSIILSFFADSNDNYTEKVYVVQSGQAYLTSALFASYVLGTFVSDEVTPL